MKRIITLFLSVAFVIGMILPNMACAGIQENTCCYSVLFNENKIPNDFNAKLAACAGEITYTVPEIGFAQVNGDYKIFSELKSLPSVSLINPSVSWSMPKVKENGMKSNLTLDTDQSSLWDLEWDIKRVTENGASYLLGTGSHNVVVGIIDSGIDRDHPDLLANLLPGSKNFVPAGGYRNTEPDETGGIDAFDDKTGHGSHVAGAISAHGKMLGVAPDTGIRAYRVFGESLAETAWITAAITAAANDGVDVISMSLGDFAVKGQVFYTDPLTGEKVALGNDIADFAAYKRAIQYAINKGSLVVLAAGNEGINLTAKGKVTDYLNSVYGDDGLSFVGAGFEVPGTIPGVVTVSATGPDDALALYSNFGPGFIDIAAPGGNISGLLEYQQNGKLDEYYDKQLYKNEFCFSTDNQGGYAYNVGTSMAVPKVAAVAALIIDKYGKIGPRKVAEMLYKQSVEPVRGKEQAYLGSGRLNAVKALTAE
ncbi:Serine protease, subtilisin family [Desulfotomaculum arcticum]|uniref:Serine protease, subtilisin family n=1 Tax=Desulfotruncus arcticus DSM 17038 TaxID=1121424 RepID=A0A1I2Q157_9FIRM|nr:S8 family serine peptidase [Desulfotruncus arcticus]SFG22018.1 Serine protease, subtilisin family [Desulfotomaculum arcticum] [Desulfotruncus arcticus DSM 17038]